MHLKCCMMVNIQYIYIYLLLFDKQKKDPSDHLLEVPKNFREDGENWKLVGGFNPFEKY